MKICHVVPSLAPSLGGPPVVASRLAAAQASLGHDVSILFYDTPAERVEVEQAMRDIPGAARLNLIRLPAPQGRLASVFAKPDIDAPIRAADVLHLHGVWESLIRAAGSASHRLNKPYVVAPHGMLDPWSLQQKALKKKIALALGYRTMLNRAAFLHVLNADEKDLLAPLGLRCPTRVIPNGVFLDEIDHLATGNGRASQLPDLVDDPFILFLSRLHYKKGLDYLADAFATVHVKAPDWQLVVAGPDGGERAAFEQRVAQLNLGDHVKVIGAVYGGAKYDLLKRAAIFCLPSRQEGFSVAILESMACRVPVVISENCHFPEVATANAGKVVPLDADAVSKAILELATNSETRAAMGAAGRGLVETNFTWEKVAERSVDEYMTNALSRG
jgi:glycosyltransferase involved in cell wall biosynthesis